MRALALDYHGYSCRGLLLAHHRKAWSARYPRWDCVIEKVDFDLLDTAALNARKMIGREQYLHDPVPRARRFIEKFDHNRVGR
jgi:hypothetical protein